MPSAAQRSGSERSSIPRYIAQQSASDAQLQDASSGSHTCDETYVSSYTYYIRAAPLYTRILGRIRADQKSKRLLKSVGRPYGSTRTLRVLRKTSGLPGKTSGLTKHQEAKLPRSLLGFQKAQNGPSGENFLQGSKASQKFSSRGKLRFPREATLPENFTEAKLPKFSQKEIENNE